MPDQPGDNTASQRARDCPRPNRLEEARSADPHNPALTDPEWQLLAEFGLNSIAALRRRMDELTLLAAYDGAPGSLTELHVERILSPTEPSAPERETTHCAGKEQAWGTIRIDYEPETRRVWLSYTVTWLDATDARQGPLSSQAGESYAVTFDVQSGKVVFRESRDT